MQFLSRTFHRRRFTSSCGAICVLPLILLQLQAFAFLSTFTSSILLTDAFVSQRSPLLSRSPAHSHLLPPSPTASSNNARTTVSNKTRLQSMWSNNDELNGSDKIKACIPYVLPILDGDSFGKYIYQRVPPLHTVDDLFLQPLVTILQAYPIISIALFILLSLGTRFSADTMSRNVRFNAQQAVLIDMVLIFPTLIMEGLEGVEIPRVYSEFGCNFVWYFYMSAVVYSIAMNLRGKKPDNIPYLSNFAETMTGPF